MKTGAIQTGIGRLALRFRHSPAVLIVVLMTVFALGGTTEGMWEETLGFFALLVPLALALGFDRMTGAAIVFLGAGSGVLASTVNPFATGVASDAAGHRGRRRHRPARRDVVHHRRGRDRAMSCATPTASARDPAKLRARRRRHDRRGA